MHVLPCNDSEETVSSCLSSCRVKLLEMSGSWAEQSEAFLGEVTLSWACENRCCKQTPCSQRYSEAIDASKSFIELRDPSHILTRKNKSIDNIHIWPICPSMVFFLLRPPQQWMCWSGVLNSFNEMIPNMVFIITSYIQHLWKLHVLWIQRN